MAAASNPSSAPLTFDLSKDLLSKLKGFQKAAGARSLSVVIRYALDAYKFNTFSSENKEHKQVSVRLESDLKEKLQRLSRNRNASVGELLRAALTAMPEKPPAGVSLETLDPTMAKKKTTKKAAKKAVKKTSAAKKKAPVKKAAKKAVKKKVAKKAPAKKAVKKKAAKKKAPAKKAVRKAVKKKAVKKKAAKKAPAKKAVKKKAAKKKAPAKKAVKKKAVKKAPRKKAAKKKK